MDRFLKAAPLALLLGLGAAPAVAAPDSAKEQASDADSERICKTLPSTGWRTAVTRICRTRGEWAKLARETSLEVRDARRRRGGSGS